jgi:hypothetical protein
MPEPSVWRSVRAAGKTKTMKARRTLGDVAALHTKRTGRLGTGASSSVWEHHAR